MRNDALLHLLRDTRRLLNFHRHCGLDYPLTGKLRAFLEGRQAAPIPPLGRPAPTETAAAVPTELPPTVSTLDDLKGELTGCRRCPLSGDGRVMLFGEGREERPALFIISAAPGSEEKKNYQAISGEARELLIRMLAAIHLDLQDVFLTNIIKCAGPAGITSAKELAAACLPLLLRQLELLRPLVVCSMGSLASQVMLKSDATLHALRGRFHTVHGLPLLATFHPSLLLKSPEMKKAAWHDLQMIQKKLALLAGKR